MHTKKTDIFYDGSLACSLNSCWCCSDCLRSIAFMSCEILLNKMKNYCLICLHINIFALEEDNLRLICSSLIQIPKYSCQEALTLLLLETKCVLHTKMSDVSV